MAVVAFTPDETLIRRVTAEFRETPGLRLTPAQAQRLWGLDEATCKAVVQRLTESRVLGRTADGRIFALQSEP